MGSDANLHDFNPWKGQYGWQMWFIFAMEGAVVANLITLMFVKNKMWMLLSGGLSLVLLSIMIAIWVKEMISVRDEVAGVDWHEATVFKDIDYIQMERIGIVDKELLNFKLYKDPDVVGLDRFSDLLEGLDWSEEDTVNWITEYYRRRERIDHFVGKEKDIKLNNPENEARLKGMVRQIEEFVSAGKSVGDVSKPHQKSESEKLLEKIQEQVPLGELAGEYTYICKLDHDYFFYDSSDHTYDYIILICNLPYGAQFKFAQNDVFHKGWWVPARTAQSALDIESWVAPDRPVMRVEWSLSETLDMKRKKTTQEPQPVHLRLIEILRSMVHNYRTKFERADIEIQQLEEEKERYHKLYSYQLQEKEYAADDWLGGEVPPDKSIMTIKKWIFITIVLGLSVPLIGCITYILATVL